MKDTAKPENENVRPTSRSGLFDGDDEDEKQYALDQVQRINAALVLREQNSVVNNGMKYTQAYLYNQQKAINYVPPRDPKDDREVSLGTVHEKVVSFIARLPSSRHASSMTSTHKLGWPTRQAAATSGGFLERQHHSWQPCPRVGAALQRAL